MGLLQHLRGRVQRDDDPADGILRLCGVVGIGQREAEGFGQRRVGKLEWLRDCHSARLRRRVAAVCLVS